MIKNKISYKDFIRKTFFYNVLIIILLFLIVRDISKIVSLVEGILFFLINYYILCFIINQVFINLDNKKKKWSIKVFFSLLAKIFIIIFFLYNFDLFVKNRGYFLIGIGMPLVVISMQGIKMIDRN